MTNQAKHLHPDSLFSRSQVPICVALNMFSKGLFDRKFLYLF